MSMTDREKNFEDRYGRDQETRFRVEARRNKLLGLWAAEKLGLQGPDADAYAQDVIREALQPGATDAFGKIRRDFDKAQVHQSDHQIRRHMEELLIEAEQQVMKE